MVDIISAGARALLFVVLVFCGGMARAGTDIGAPYAPQVTISIVGTNDLHGHLEALPRFGGYLANLRRERARTGGGVLLLDGGDLFQGTLESNMNEGAAVTRAYNVLGYDAVAIGNHDFDYGPAGPAHIPTAPGDDPRGALKARAAEARFPFLAANLVDAATGAPPAWPNVRGTTTVTVAGVSIGVIGLANVGTATMTQPANFAGLRALPLAPVVIAAANDLRRRGAVAVVVVAHVGGKCTKLERPDDLSSCEPDGEIFQLARALPAGTVDAIVAGHVHDAIAHSVAGIPIIETYCKGVGFGRIDLTIRRAGAKTRAAVVGATIHAPIEDVNAATPLATTYEGAGVTPDAAVAAAIAPALAAARAKRQEKLGVTVARAIVPAYAAESALGNLIADLMRAARPKADVALTNAGTIRAELPAGPLSYGQLHEVLPFDDGFATISVTGAELSSIVARNLARAGSIVILSGVRAQARCAHGALGVSLARADGKPIGGAERLTLVTTEFLAAGGGGVFPAEIVAQAGKPEGPSIRDTLADLLRARRTPLDPDHPAVFDAARPRLSFPGQRPVHCR